jgi:LysM repeat protein
MSSIPLHGRAVNAPAGRARGRRRRWRQLSPAARYAIVLATLIVFVTVVQFVAHALRAEPRDMRAIADRELQVNMLASGERPLHTVSVFHRPAIDYFRATRGVLVLTDRRLIFLGLRPRDFLAPIDAPPTFDQRDFAVDTLVRVTSGRAMMWLAPGIVIRTPDETIRLAIPSAAREDARALVATLQQRDTVLRAEGRRQGDLRDRALAQREAALAELRKPRRYTVRPGDAMGSIATRWSVTTEQLRKWNGKPDLRIRVGEELVVRPGGNP